MLPSTDLTNQRYERIILVTLNLRLTRSSERMMMPPLQYEFNFALYRGTGHSLHRMQDCVCMELSIEDNMNSGQIFISRLCSLERRCIALPLTRPWDSSTRWFLPLDERRIAFTWVLVTRSRGSCQLYGLGETWIRPFEQRGHWRTEKCETVNEHLFNHPLKYEWSWRRICFRMISMSWI